MPKYILPQLPYPYNALEPYIDTRTMEIHHQKHHQGYIDKLNASLERYPWLFNKTIEQLLENISQVPEDIRQSIINNGGGHYNHSLFWKIMAPPVQVGGGQPSGALAEAIDSTFGSFTSFREQFTETALNRFGSGWAWLVKDKSNNLKVYSTPNQDSPLMEGYLPLLGLDVWEHAYYLLYQNRRADYINAWWNLVNWPEVERRYQ